MAKKKQSGAETRYTRFMENINSVGVSKAIRDYRDLDLASHLRRQVQSTEWENIKADIERKSGDSELVNRTAEDK